MAGLSLWNPMVSMQLNPIQYFFYQRRWITRSEVEAANLPALAYEIAPESTNWRGVTARYYFNFDSSSGEEVHAQYSSRQEEALASLAMTTLNSDIEQIHPFLFDQRVTARLEPTCRSFDINWPDAKKKCSCTIDSWLIVCLTWWTNDRMFVLASTELKLDELQDFANSLTPISE